jgi:hypothetical protein
VIHDFSITDMTPRPGYPRYWDAVVGSWVYCVGHRIVDAHGRQVLMCQWCDTETGEVVRVDYDLATNKYAIDPATGRVKTIRERRPAPLTVRELKPDEPYLMPQEK